MSIDEKNRQAYEAEGTGTKTLEALEEAVRYNRWLVSLMSPYFGEKNLELGAGTGTMTAVALSNAPVETVEAAPENHKKLLQRFAGLSNYSDAGTDFFRIPQNEQYDSIFSANVLEHFEDDLEVIRYASGLLKPGGCFLAVVPAGGKLLFSEFDNDLGHHRRYARKDKHRIRAFLHSNCPALELESFRFYNPIGFFGWLVMMKWAGRRSIKPSSIAGMEFLIPIQSALIDWLPLPFGQNLRIVIRKR